MVWYSQLFQNFPVRSPAVLLWPVTSIFDGNTLSVSSVQSSHSVMSNSLQPHEWQHTRPPCPSPGTPVNSRSSLKLTSMESLMPSSHLILCHPLLLLPPIPPSIRVFSNESTLRKRWPKYWSFSFSIIPSKEHPGLISFRMDWLDLLAVQGTLKSLLQVVVQFKILSSSIYEFQFFHILTKTWHSQSFSL